MGRIEKLEIDATMPVGKLQQQAQSAIGYFQRVEQHAQKMQTTLQKLAFAQGRNQLRVPSPEFGRQGVPINAARAQEIFTQSTEQATASIRDELLAINQLHRAQERANVASNLASQIQSIHAERTALVAKLNSANAAATTENAIANDGWRNSVVSAADAQSVLATRLGQTLTELKAAQGALTPFQLLLEKMGVKNSNFGKSVQDWNLLSTMRSPGILVTTLDQLKNTFAGIIPPIRQVEYAIQNFAIPALSALAVELHRGNPAARLLGRNLLKVADDIQHLGTTTKTTSRTLTDFVVQPIESAIGSLRRYSVELTTSEAAQARFVQAQKNLTNVSAWKNAAAKLVAASVSASKNAAAKLFAALRPKSKPPSPAPAAPEPQQENPWAKLTTPKPEIAAPTKSVELAARASSAFATGLSVVRSALIGTSSASIAWRAALIPTIAVLLNIPGSTAAAANGITWLVSSLFTVSPAGTAAISMLGAVTAKLAAFAMSVKGAFALGAAAIWRGEIVAALSATASGIAGWIFNSRRLTGAAQAVSVSLRALAATIRGPLKAALFVGKHALGGFVSGLSRAATIATFGMAAPLSSTLFGLSKFIRGVRGAGDTSRVSAQGIGVMRASLLALAPMVAGIGLAAAGAMSAVSTIKHGFVLAANLEQAEVAFTTMLGSADKAKSAIADITAFSAKTPFQMPDLVEMGRGLLSAKTSAEQLVPTMRVLGDISAATNTPLSEMTDIYTKIKLQGKAGLEEIMQLARRNVPIFEELEKVTGQNRTALLDMVSDGQIGITEIQKAFINLTSAGGTFENMMDKQSGTMAGLWSTLTDNINLTAVEIANALSSSLNFKGALRGLIEFTEWIRIKVTRSAMIISVIGSTITARLAPVFQWLADHSEQIGNTIWAIVKGTSGMLWSLSNTVSTITRSAIGAFAALATFIGLAGEHIGNDLRSLADGTVNFGKVAQEALWGTEFAFLNWRQVVEYAGLSSLLWFVRFNNQLGHLMKVQIPAYLAWFGRNWYSALYDAAKGLATFIANVGINLGYLMASIEHFFQSGEWKFKWTPLEEGFKATVQEMPKILDREMSPFEHELDKRTKEAGTKLGQNFADFHLAKMQQAGEEAGKNLAEGINKGLKKGLEIKPLIPDPKQDPDADPTKAASKRQSNNRNEAILKGSKEAASVISQFRADTNRKTPHQQQQEANGKQQIQNQKQQIQILQQIMRNTDVKIADF